MATTCVSSSIFLTGQAPNPLALELSAKSGIVAANWGTWFLAFLPVGIILFIITPLLTYVFCKPEVKGSPEIAAWAKDEYKKLGSMTRSEIFMALISVLALVLWIGASTFKINPTTTALIVIILMIFTKIMTWQDFLANKPAWNVLTWFATLVPMASGLKNVGFLEWLAKSAGGSLVSLDPTMAVLGLLLAFCLLRYFFASGTAYISAMLPVFLIVGINAGIDPTLLAFILIGTNSYGGSVTHYGAAPGPIIFSAGYNNVKDWWTVGLVTAVVCLVLNYVIGIPWWKITGFM